jgi:uncharacterized damage-inducible protein DinB
MSSEHSKTGTVDKSNHERLFQSVDNITSELVEVVSFFNDQEINEIPFEGSWTAAQVAEHVRKSNNGIAQALQMQGRRSERNADERVKELKDVFLDFDTKFKSPEFILPAQTSYNKKDLVERLKRSIERIKQERVNADLSEIIDLTALGTISKIELLHFVIYHTQRHIHQLKNIFKTIKMKPYGTDQSLSQFSGNNRGGI